MMLRSTKIVATLGPASSDPATLERMVRAGVDVVRLNFSHGTAQDHENRAALVRDISRKAGRTVAIMCDLQGPKIRIGKFKDGKVTLEKGARFVLDAACELGDAERVGLDYKELPRDVEEGVVLLLDDGKIVLEVTAVRGDEVQTRVRHGGVLSNNKGINRQGGGLTAAALTPKDIDDIRTAAKINADYLAVSFPKSGADMYMARELLRAAGYDTEHLVNEIDPDALSIVFVPTDGWQEALPQLDPARTVLVAGFALAACWTLIALFVRRWRWPAIGVFAVLCAGLAVLWSSLAPTNDRDWQTDLAVLPYATIAGDKVTVHNIRNFDYRTETDYTPRYYDKQGRELPADYDELWGPTAAGAVRGGVVAQAGYRTLAELRALRAAGRAPERAGWPLESLAA